MGSRANPFDGREFSNKRRKVQSDEGPEYFNLVEYTASLDPFTLQRRIDAESSLYRWAEVVLGYENLAADCDYRLYEPIHRPMCDRAEEVLPIRGREKRAVQRKLLDLEPRGSLKTNLDSVASCLYYLVFNYDGRILISSHNHKAAKEILSIIKWNMEFNETFKKFYGDWSYFAKKFGVWREDQIELAFRTKSLREPTIDTCGAEISKTGGHYEFIVVDDIQNRENVKSETERANVRERLQEYYPQLEPYGGMLIVGTRYHKQDVYSWIMKRKEDALKNEAPPEYLFEIVVRSAWNKDNTLYYPTRLSAAFLAQQEIELEPYLFAVWYRNEPIDDSAKVFINPEGHQRDFDFIKDYVPYIELPNGNRRSVRTTLSWDPAGRESTSKRADFHGITVNATDTIDVWWTLVALELKLPLDQLLDKVCSTIDFFGVTEMSIETRGAGTQGLYIDLLRPVLERWRLGYITIHEWNPGTKDSKDTLIRGLQPRYRRGGWWFRRGYCNPLIRQLDDFPQLEHDDVLDSAVQQKTISRPPDPYELIGQDDSEGDFDAEEGTQESDAGPSVGLGTPDYSAA